jgi:glutamate synthase domain-containing protein 2/glutamate synthase domain-containing protein 1/glutamate synthase domain-containing protein 3
VDIKGTPSRLIVEKALAGLVNLTHRGGVGADARTGDGAGLLIQIPHKLFAPVLAQSGALDLLAGEYGVAMLFLPTDVSLRAHALEEIMASVAGCGMEMIARRDVPVEPGMLGDASAAMRPHVVQLFIRRPVGLDADAFERELMLLRRAMEHRLAGMGLTDDDFFAVSCSARTIVYKGLCLPEDLTRFYPDLADPRVESAIALFHQRFSTNTQSTWGLAQPFRLIAHNGEINTIQGNRSWMRARTADLLMSDGTTGATLAPVVAMTGSDSLSLDTALELLRHSGRSLPHALMMAIPEPWEQLPHMDDDRRAFYDFHAGIMEQWDGPAALGFSDGVLAGAALDRNGLRPLRYAITSEGWFVAGSEAGTVEIDQSTIVEQGRLGPGQMILVDTELGVVVRNDELKQNVAVNAPYAEWLRQNRIPFNAGPVLDEPLPVPVETDAKTRAALTRAKPAQVALQRAFGYTAEDIRLIVTPMAGEHKEPTWSMGDDAPLAVLSEVPRPLTAYFRQRFAQVTNPPIDSLRERSVMALDTWLGPRHNLLERSEKHARLVHLRSMVLAANEMEAIRTLDQLKMVEISTVFATSDSESTLETALDRIVERAEREVRDGAEVLVLSDRAVDADHAPVPMVLVVGAIHNRLIDAGLRMRADLVCETGEVWDVHQLAVLIGYGAAAVHPWMALEAAVALSGTRGYEHVRPLQLRQNYIGSLEYGFLKVMSKMGISTVSGYRGAHIFEILGLGSSVVERCFPDTPSRLGGIGFSEIEEDIRKRHGDAYTELSPRLPDQGMIKFKKDGESHSFAPVVVTAIQAAAQNNDKAAYEEYRALARQQPLTTIRDLLELRPVGDPVPLDEVESAMDIAKRFVVTAMSLGSLSPEAHATLSIAMNRIGARSNSGEGGEDPAWYDTTGPDIPHSKVKQVASGRFGVTTRYLTMAEELEIKIAQGAKPGEGGQLPGFKVTEFVARMRHAVEGLPLISPPPHHDIYSIEDLAQLIFDLRQVNPHARIGVKLVAEAGVGTVAAGVVKALADYVLISGHSGGTGAAPLASIKHAGVPWELGLSEAQQTLVMNGLRPRVRLRTDGGLRTPEDVIFAAMFGADEFGFGTSVLVAMGCDMARQCHLNTCPTGIATQRADLRAKFKGTPEMVIGYFDQLTQGIRELLAELGARSIEELIGRTDLIARKPVEGRAALLDVSALLPAPASEDRRRKSIEVDRSDEVLDDRLWAQIQSHLAQGQPVDMSSPVQTSDRTVGARIAGNLTRLRETDPVSPANISLHFTGSAGQSFGAFAVPGMTLALEGQANDYVGKGMNGGEIAIFPRSDAAFATPQTIAGNTILYGATGGHMFIAGTVGERFMVRNSGATAVVEGVGDHGCEYMTGGQAVVLGPTGRNFGAGMTNGRAWVYDPAGDFETRINSESIEVEPMDETSAWAVRQLIERHVEVTGSAHARDLLDRWRDVSVSFRQVVPRAVRELRMAEAEMAEGAAD